MLLFALNFSDDNVGKSVFFRFSNTGRQTTPSEHCKDKLNNYSFCLHQYCIKRFILFG